MVFRLQPWCSLLVVGVVVVLGVCAGVGEAIPPPLCYNQKLALTPYARRLCAALNDISRFSRAMEDYLDAQGKLTVVLSVRPVCLSCSLGPRIKLY